MKRILSLILAMLLLFSATGCGGSESCTHYTVPNPMSYPKYTFDDTPDTDMLRQMAVTAMRDLLSIQWCTETEIEYRKTGPASNKKYCHVPNTTYGGMLYSGANTGLFQFLEYYDNKTGYLQYPGSSSELTGALGSSCADTLLWAWATVCNSFAGGYYPVMMVPKNGYCLVGNYTVRDGISSYNEYPSYIAIQDNGNDVILDAYTKMLPADALISYSDNHAMMVIEAPTVRYHPSGRIDSANSYVMIQDQRAGGETFFEGVVDGHTVYYNGRTSAKITFDFLLEKHYIPVTTQEFLGIKPYEKAQINLNTEPPIDWESLLATTITSNYPLAVLNTYLIEPDGTQVSLDKTLFGGYSEQGVPTRFSMGDLEVLERLDKSKCANCKLIFEVVVSTGERFIPIEFSL